MNALTTHQPADNYTACSTCCAAPGTTHAPWCARAADTATDTTTAAVEQLFAMPNVAHVVADDLNRRPANHRNAALNMPAIAWVMEIHDQLFAHDMVNELDVWYSILGSKPRDLDAERLNNS